MLQATYTDSQYGLLKEAGINVGGGEKVPKILNEEVGINVEGEIFWKKLVHNCNK